MEKHLECEETLGCDLMEKKGKPPADEKGGGEKMAKKNETLGELVKLGESDAEMK